MTVVNGDPMHEVCIPHGIPRWGDTLLRYLRESINNCIDRRLIYIYFLLNNLFYCIKRGSSNGILDTFINILIHCFQIILPEIIKQLYLNSDNIFISSRHYRYNYQKYLCIFYIHTLYTWSKTISPINFFREPWTDGSMNSNYLWLRSQTPSFDPLAEGAWLLSDWPEETDKLGPIN